MCNASMAAYSKSVGDFMISTLDEARKLEAKYPGKVDIIREVRWYARIFNTKYLFFNDWETEQLDGELWLRDKKGERKYD